MIYIYIYIYISYNLNNTYIDDHRYIYIYKDNAFCGFSPCPDPILEMPTFRKPCSPLHQDEEQSDTELFLRIVPFIYYATWKGEGKVENCRWGRGKRWGKSVSL